MLSLKKPKYLVNVTRILLNLQKYNPNVRSADLLSFPEKKCKIKEDNNHHGCCWPEEAGSQNIRTDVLSHTVFSQIVMT